MLTKTEQREEYTKTLLKDLYSRGYSMADIKAIGLFLGELTERILADERNTIGSLGNGKIYLD